MDDLPVSATSEDAAAAPQPAAPDEYLLIYSWPPYSPPVLLVLGGWLVALIWLVTPAILTPGIQKDALRERPSLELPSVATYLEQIPQLAADGRKQRAVLPKDLQELPARLDGIGRLHLENSLRGYTYRFAQTTFTPQADQSWWQLFKWVTEPRRLLKGSLILLVLLTPLTFFRTRNLKSPIRDRFPRSHLFVEAALSSAASIVFLPLRVAFAAAVVGFVSELLALLYWGILTAFPSLGVLFGMLFGLCGILPYVLIAIQVMFMLALIGRDSPGAAVGEFNWRLVAHQWSWKRAGKGAQLLWGSLVLLTFAAGLATTILMIVVGPRWFTRVESYVAAHGDARGVTWQPAVMATILFAAFVLLWRFLPSEFKLLNPRLRHAIHLTRNTLRIRQPQATALWHSCRAVGVPNGSSLVSVQILTAKTEPVFLIWDGEDTAHYVGERVRDSDDHRNRSWVPISKAAISDLSNRLADSASTTLNRAISAASAMREAGQPLIPALESLLATGTDKVRAEVCYALGYIGGPAATLLLSKCLSDPEAMVRHSALRGLERLKLPIDQLRGLLLPHKDDADPVIATIVAAVLAAAEASQNPVK